MEGTPRVGQRVVSRAGRDCGLSMVVVGVADNRYVLVADGVVRRLARPKRKNTRHLQVRAEIWGEIASGLGPTDEALRQWLRQFAERGDGQQ